MSKLADFMTETSAPPVPGMEIEIDAMCQTCFAYVEKAEYFTVQRLLKWVCPEGHISFIEEFRL